MVISKKVLLLFVGLALFVTSLAQTRKITGKVTGPDQQPLEGATVVVKGLGHGTSTLKDGSFVINVPETGNTLIFSFTGMEVQEVPLADKTTVRVQLKGKVSKLDDVVVIGYGTQKRRDLTGAVSTLSSQAYKEQPVLNASSAIQGRVAGVSVTNNSGAPGGSVKLRIRGPNSINGGNDPLYVVDGVALGSTGLGDLNVSDIASMEVLKDASATAVYGSRGANGVVLITTKSGSSGVPRIEYNGFVSFNRPMKKYSLMDPVTYAKMANLTSGVNTFPDPQSYAGKGTDWQNMIFSNSVTQSHELSVTGGKEGVKYYVSGFYIDQQGLLVNSSQKRFGFRSNLDVKLSSRLDFGVNVYLARINSHNNGDMGSKGNPVTGALTWAPTEAVYDAPGQYNRFGISPIWANPYMTIKESDNDNFGNIGVFNARLKYAITDWLTFTVNAALDLKTAKSASLRNDWISPGNPGSSQGSTESYTFQNSNILTFHKTFDKHDLTATALVEESSNKYNYFNASGSGLASLSNGYHNLGLNASQSINSGYSNWALLSYMGRVAYSYNDKYLLTATLRRDGSSKFQGNNKWSSFPSFSAGWKLSNEKFIDDLGVFSNLKLRAGWGVTGNQAIDPYSTLGLLNSVIYSYGTPNGYQGYTLGNPATPNVKWETSKQTDIGLDMGFLNGRINITADYYNKNTSDLLLFTRIANYDGGGSYLKNIGKVNNKGWEFMIEGTPYKGRELTWSTSLNLSFNKNKVIDLGKDSLLERNVIGGGLISAPIQVVKVGQPMGAFYLIPWEGVYQSDNGAYKAGDAKYRDVNGNGSIGFEDRVIAGSATPTFIWGFNNSFAYKNFELNIFIQGSHGNKIFNATYAATAIPTSDVKFINLADAANYWTSSNTNSTWANPASKNKSWIESTQFLQDGGYVRLKNVSLSYTLPKNLLKVAAAKVYVSAQNIATLTKYKGFDPEATTVGGDVDAGIDLGAYPSPKTVTVGLQVKF
ncbi:SusC/RagA family TonB-linked outer membrane protein [Chitinophaga eiseniae]|uniref:TonB-dependent receptor n=1 Tax=Chitinophaga eiseniae TaxID=634771 RepID=A0A847SDF0_9BACT|nr:TonB-dependent receptor [Chitinophaga eiseniae]NLR81230.1 TonB-dependent receptor [Chitinophaga eiseniae]